jgi:hypothetical protein
MWMTHLTTRRWTWMTRQQPRRQGRKNHVVDGPQPHEGGDSHSYKQRRGPALAAPSSRRRGKDDGEDRQSRHDAPCPRLVHHLEPHQARSAARRRLGAAPSQRSRTKGKLLRQLNQIWLNFCARRTTDRSLTIAQSFELQFSKGLF